MTPMQPYARKRLLALWWPMCLPVLALVLLAAGLGYGVAMHASLQHTVAAGSGLSVQLAVAATVFAGLLGWLYIAARKVLLPWLALAQAVQSRTRKDASHIKVAPNVPSEVRATAQALNHLITRASTETDTEQRFIADAAHQLRTPLAALQAQVEAWALMAHAAPEKNILLRADQVDQLRLASRRTSQLTNQLLALSRAERCWEQEDAAQRVDLKSLCETLLASFLDRALRKNLDLGLEAQAAHVTGYEWLLRELISNLLDNAIKYTPAGGQVTLRCGRQGSDERQGRAYVEVEDDGPGVSVGEYTRLTQRFYRAPGAASEGTGLGLAIAQEIAQGHGAQLHFAPGAQRRGLRVMLLFKE